MDGPVFESEGSWWFWGLEGVLGPYRTRTGAEEKYEMYMAYVINAPSCHHE